MTRVHFFCFHLAFLQCTEPTSFLIFLMLFQDLLSTEEGSSAVEATARASVPPRRRGSASAGAATGSKSTPSAEELEATLLDAEDEEDRDAAAKLRTEMSSELQEFDETKPLDDAPVDPVADAADPNSMLQEQLERLRGMLLKRGGRQGWMREQVSRVDSPLFSFFLSRCGETRLDCA